MARCYKTVPLDEYILDVLMRDLVGHDHKPAAYLVYLYLYGEAVRARWRPLPASLREIAESIGLSKSAVQNALILLRRRELIATASAHLTATPAHRILRPWRSRR